MNFPSAKSKQELFDMVENKKALPDFIHKRNIFELQCEMNRAHGFLMQSIMKNGGYVNNLKAIELRSSIIMLFLGIKDMIESNGCLDMSGMQKTCVMRSNEVKGVVKSDFQRCVLLCYDYKSNYTRNDVRELFYLCSYVNFALNKIGITDLLIENEVKDTPIEDL